MARMLSEREAWLRIAKRYREAIKEQEDPYGICGICACVGDLSFEGVISDSMYGKMQKRMEEYKRIGNYWWELHERNFKRRAEWAEKAALACTKKKKPTTSKRRSR